MSFDSGHSEKCTALALEGSYHHEVLEEEFLFVPFEVSELSCIYEIRGRHYRGTPSQE
jgi:hypothetical protein